MSDLHPLQGPSAQGLARALDERRLAAPAALLLELLKPWRFVASQMLIMSEPVWGDRRTAVRRYAEWLEAPGGIEALLDALERPSTPEAEHP